MTDLVLASLVLHGDADSRGQVGYTDGRFGFVDMLGGMLVDRKVPHVMVCNTPVLQHLWNA